MKIFVPLANESILVSKYDEPASDLIKYIQDFTSHTLCNDPGSADLIIILEEWATRDKYYYKKIESCPIAIEHLEKVYVINCDDLTDSGGNPVQDPPIAGFTKIGITNVVPTGGNRILDYIFLCDEVVGAPGGGASCGLFGGLPVMTD